MAQRVCECGRPIVQNGPGRPRKKCEACSPSKPRHVQTLPAPVVPLAPPTAPPSSSGAGQLEAATLTELEAAGRTATAAGTRVLVAARLVDAGGYTAAGAAALLRAHREALDAALDGVRPAADALDELAARREQRFA